MTEAKKKSSRKKPASKRSLKKGDAVSWKSSGGTAHGEVVKKVTGTAKVKGHTAKASKDAPQYEVKSDRGGKAIHKAEALTKE